MRISDLGNVDDNKYLLLEIGNEIESLEIVSVGREAVFLRIKNED